MHRDVGLLAPLRDYVDTLVHPTALQDALTSARHRAFIAPRLIGSLIALAAFPVYVALRGVPSMLEALVFAWLLAPVLIAYFLSRTGYYEGAHVLSSFALAGLVTAVAVRTGAIGSFAAIWLVVVPLEAMLSASRRVVTLASAFAIGACGLLLFLGTFDMLPTAMVPAQGKAALAALGIVSATLYATGLAFGAESLARTSFWLAYAEEDRYRVLARNMPDVITRHGKGGEVLFASPAAEALFGVRAQELLGQGLFDRVHVADRPAYLTALAGMAAPGDAGSGEFRLRRGEGQDYLWIEMRCRALGQAGRINNGELVAVLRDITRRKEHDEEAERARADAERANSAKSKFLATMSHELRTPLNAIIGFSEMLAKEGSFMLDAKRRHDYAHLINESGLHLLSVVNGILDMSKIETGNFEITPEPFAPQQVIEDCCDLLRYKAREAEIEVECRMPGSLPEIVADKRSLNQIMLNLISNAIKFTGDGGKITVSAAAEDGAIAVSVEDTGVGIDAEDLPRIGDPFFQARSSYDRRHDGTGLGLSIVKGLLTLHGGDLRVTSKVGEGTRVTIRLPLDCGGAGKRGVVEDPAARGVEPENRMKISA